MRLKLEYFETGEELEKITDLSYEELGKKGLDFDDWDYGFVTSVNKKLFQLEDLTPRLLQGSCSNRWIKVQNHSGLDFWVGMAYHS